MGTETPLLEPNHYDLSQLLATNANQRYPRKTGFRVVRVVSVDASSPTGAIASLATSCSKSQTPDSPRNSGVFLFNLGRLTNPCDSLRLPTAPFFAPTVSTPRARSLRPGPAGHEPLRPGVSSRLRQWYEVSHQIKTISTILSNEMSVPIVTDLTKSQTQVARK